ncbi:hypothetical protein B0H19DRAFT_1151649 [Mycena capillaripes]|nr:hypothetical protein B0H19DRAFT_1151649 [Mycena capillaripes]
MHFQDLDEDILPRILAQCDVHTVLRLGQVNRLLHVLTLRRELWLALISDLAFHGIIDPPSSDTLLRLNTRDLIYEIKRTVAGPRTWSPTSTSPPKVARVLTLPLPGAAARMLQGLRVLPGGQYIALLRNIPASSLEIWSIARRECVWLWQTPIQNIVWSIDVVTGGVFVHILVHEILVPAPVIVYRVSLETGDATCLFQQALPCVWFHSDPHILGDYFLAVITRVGKSLSGRGRGPAEEHAVLLVNWQEKTYVALKCDATQKNLFQCDIRRSSAPGTHHHSLPAPTPAVQGCRQCIQHRVATSILTPPHARPQRKRSLLPCSHRPRRYRDAHLRFFSTPPSHISAQEPSAQGDLYRDRDLPSATPVVAHSS